jgi:hypothetical protein
MAGVGAQLLSRARRLHRPAHDRRRIRLAPGHRRAGPGAPRNGQRRLLDAAAARPDLVPRRHPGREDQQGSRLQGLARVGLQHHAAAYLRPPGDVHPRHQGSRQRLRDLRPDGDPGPREPRPRPLPVPDPPPSRRRLARERRPPDRPRPAQDQIPGAPDDGAVWRQEPPADEGARREGPGRRGRGPSHHPAARRIPMRAAEGKYPGNRFDLSRSTSTSPTTTSSRRSASARSITSSRAGRRSPARNTPTRRRR